MPESDLAREGFPELSKAEFARRFFNGDDTQFVWVLRFFFTPLSESIDDRLKSLGVKGENSDDRLKSLGLQEQVVGELQHKKRGRPKGAKNKEPPNGSFYCQNPKTNYHTYHYHFFDANGEKRKSSVGVPPQRLKGAIAMKEQNYSLEEILNYIKGID